MLIESELSNYVTLKPIIESILVEYGNNVIEGSLYFKHARSLIALDKSLTTQERTKHLKDLLRIEACMVLKHMDDLELELTKLPESEGAFMNEINDKLTKRKTDIAAVDPHLFSRTDISEKEKFETVKQLIDSDANPELVRFVFEYFISLNENAPDLWRLYVKFVSKNVHHAEIKTRILRRATRYLPRDVHLYIEALEESYRLSEENLHVDLRVIFTEMSNRLKSVGIKSLRLCEAYFMLLVHSTVRSLQKEDFPDNVENLLSVIGYFNQLHPNTKELTFDDRKSLANIYKGYLTFIFRIDKEFHDKAAITDVCERLVKLCGNEPDSWLLYIRSLELLHPIDTVDPIRNIYKRAIRFCKGDVTLIYESYRHFEAMFGQNDKERAEVDALFRAAKEGTSTNVVKEGVKAHGKAGKVDIEQTAPQSKINKMKNMRDIYEKNEKGAITVFIKGIPITYERSDVLDLLPNVIPDSVSPTPSSMSGSCNSPRKTTPSATSTSCQRKKPQPVSPSTDKTSTAGRYSWRRANRPRRTTRSSRFS